MRTQGATVVAAAFFLVAATPASAVTGGFGVAKALKAAGLPILLAPKTTKGKQRSCEADSPRIGGKSTNFDGAYGKLTRLNQPVACEQPPRSEFAPPYTRNQATTAGLAVVG